METSEQATNRKKNGQFAPGQSGNPGGRPKSGTTIIDKFRENETSQVVINKLFEIASTLNTDDEHKEAMSAAKVIVDKLIPSLKSQEIKMDIDNERGFVFMPEQKESDKQ
mgnify:FL=1|tara:strand:+ start:102 stop:431 length:330 start_codon:yes stop_codon:yes gene_type:complete